MNIIETELKASKTDPRVDQILKLAIMAVGGQGGGVLANWIDKLCRRRVMLARQPLWPELLNELEQQSIISKWLRKVMETQYSH